MNGLSGFPPAESSSQAEIVRGVVEGERWANVALYERLLPAVLGALQRILHAPSAEYEDLVQMTFERIVRVLVGQRGTPPAHLAGWAAAIAAHVALDALRVRIRERRIFFRDRSPRDSSDAHAEAATGPNLEARLEARRQLAAVQEHLARMNPDQAQTLLLHDALGHDLAEIAEITGVSVAAAQKRLFRGRQELLRRAKRREGEMR
jgi:RNA polymerase sigma-70 factor (ECF subfamily)